MATEADIANRLGTRLATGKVDANRFSSWYEGDQDPPETLKDCTTLYQRLRHMSRTNWAGLVIDAAADRLAVEGFRFGASADPAEPWEIWQANDLDADSSMAMLEALVVGRCPVMVVADGSHPSGVRITIEDPREVAVEYQPGGSHRVVAALKRWTDNDDRQTTELMLPGRLIKWEAHDLGANLAGVPPMETVGAAEVPIVELVANARVGRPGRSDLRPGINHLERIDKLTFDMVTAAEFGAFRQKWATGMEVPRDQDDQPKAPFHAMMDRLAVSEDAETKFGTFDATDLRPYIAAIEASVQHLAATTKTPPHYLLSGMTNLSADAIRAAEAALVTRVRRHQRSFGEAWERVIRRALSITSSPLASEVSAETIWRTAETRTAAELADAVTKLRQGVGVPQEAAWQIWGAGPQEIAEWRSMAAREAFLAPQAPAQPVA